MKQIAAEEQKETTQSKWVVRTTITGLIVVAYCLIPLIYGMIMWYFEGFDTAQFSTMFNSWLETFKYVIVTVITFYFVNKQNEENTSVDNKKEE